jgi:nicotinate-nucleotide--dimethylbenzimidazole phosphoribosyltransferase
MTSLLERTIASVPRADAAVAAETARLLDAKTKPLGSLGRLEWLACRLGATRGEVVDHVLAPAIVVAAADHGVGSRGVSAYPREVTRQMLANFAGGGAAVSVLAREAGARLVVVDCGVDRDDASPDATSDATSAGIVDAAIVRGTDDLTLGPAMTREVAVAMVERGIALATELARDGVEIVAVGEMGIGNTTSASAIVAALTGAPVETVCGPGTGLDAEGIARKVGAVRDGLDVNRVTVATQPLEVLARVGGLEIAFLVGLMLGAAGERLPVVLDGFITGAAALVAARLSPRVVDAMIAGTRSPEPGHDLVLSALGFQPLVDLGLRLGEGSGAALALSVVRACVAILTEMATFDAAGVSDREDRRALTAG